MMALGAGSARWFRILRIAGRVALCLAFVLPPLAAHAVPHHETRACMSAGAVDTGCAGTETPQVGEAACCHALAPCLAMVAPPPPALGPDRMSSPVAAVPANVPASVITPPLFRPPRSAFPA